MRKKSHSYVNDPIVYLDGKERRSLDLRPYGVECIPFLGLSNFQTARIGTEEHIHEGCVEISLCLRGNLAFEADGIEYPFLPGSVFVSQPHEPHRMRHNPKGLMLQRILFQIPRKGARVLDLPRRENAWLVQEMQNFPVRLFPATERVKVAFTRLFELYDSEERGTVSCRLKMKAAVLELLLALIEAPHAPASPKGRPHAKVKAIVERLRKMPEENYPVEDLAREAALSVVAFTDAFKRATGLPPHAFLLDQRVKAARIDLADPRKSVASIAAKYRFSSPQHFATVFKRITGQTPCAYRNRCLAADV
ncbi:MAG: AraC family transcriptional regulator [Kiritimatiellae bacterium]|nr:AraC family transcriptional regulator [Kiritimatiellia bacterium]